MNHDHYSVLGLLPQANPDQIRRAYKARALETHPDKDKSSDASDAFQRVQQAFEVLRDPAKRRAYDLQHGFAVERPPPDHASEAQRRRKDREEWARGIWKSAEGRPRQQPPQRQEQAAAEYQALVQRMLAELYRQNPDWKLRQLNAKAANRS
uniref:J domain-containing protein n=1 Tax=Mycena chlorophos TaxID=658473 RepID=A0ABQ0LVJ7_MYCCL|nr:predicted protein [Mycena chlorophos]